MSAFLRKILKEWDMEEYIQKFIDQEFDEASFMVLDEKYVAQLIPKMGPRIRFMKKLEVWRKAKEPWKNPWIFRARANIEETRRSTPECQAGPSTSFNSYPNTAKPRSNPFEITTSNATFRSDIIRGYLNQTSQGKSILKKYETSTWTETDRHVLAGLIINEETRISTERLKKLAELIEQAFPIESAQTYYVPYENNKTTGTRTPARGKLLTQYNKTRIEHENRTSHDQTDPRQSKREGTIFLD